MKIAVVDNERIILQGLISEIKSIRSDAEVVGFCIPTEADEWIRENKPDIVFSDIEMPEMNGLELASRIRSHSPHTRIVFITAFDTYMGEAFYLHADGYVMKPFRTESIKKELDYHFQEQSDARGKIYFQTFGGFETFVDNQKVRFNRKKAKEVLAFLVDRDGANISYDDLAVIINDADTPRDKAKRNLQVYVNDLAKTLSEYGLEDMLIRSRQGIGLKSDMTDSDLRRFLKGNADAVNSYRGSYMDEYPWAKQTQSVLEQKKG